MAGRRRARRVELAILLDSLVLETAQFTEVSGTGRNMLGLLLMEVRQAIREGQNASGAAVAAE